MSLQRDIPLQQTVFKWLMQTLDEMPKGKSDYDKWISDGTILVRGEETHKQLSTVVGQLGRSPMDRALASHHESRGSNPGANKCHAQVR